MFNALVRLDLLICMFCLSYSKGWHIWDGLEIYHFPEYLYLIFLYFIDNFNEHILWKYGSVDSFSRINRPKKQTVYGGISLQMGTSTDFLLPTCAAGGFRRRRLWSRIDKMKFLVELFVFWIFYTAFNWYKSGRNI